MFVRLVVSLFLTIRSNIFQSRFLVGAQTNKNDGGNSLWDVGLTFTTESQKDFENTKPNFWTNQTSNLTVIAAPENSGWYIFNIQSIGKYKYTLTAP